ncbi:NYN domain-containing protein, partial [Longimicrobium sp.]|uniref:NYN domain-containing protein n=1 Tax=Longimicrobium sp. TaxID=2029185 RepID=UPI003B3A0D0A
MNNNPLRSSPAMTGGPALSATRSAALLIDFDNVTMNVRSDLGKELKSLLDSDVFRGKIAVRRAYADWRRYPASVVPLTEASVDLIFAPAYGTSKKNATDLRMAVDAIELAFMRPEIGVFILLTGDSDFSSCVMKLKEYGKYVIGVGMRESASDLLIQNCDEYYSYHNLSGLTRATDDTGVREDPWELVTKAAQMMARRGDVMRVDRLKQVMVELDSGFSEKDIGYGKFSKFITEAQQRGAVRLRRTDGGDWEVAPPRAEEGDAQGAAGGDGGRPERDRGERERSRGGRGRGRFGDRGGRDRDRGERPRYEPPVPVDTAAGGDAVAVPAEASAPPVFAEPDVEAQAPARAPEPQARPERERPAPAERPAPSATEAPTAQAPAAQSDVDPLRNAYALLQHTVRQMVRRPGETARDGDVKRKMLELQPGFDEHALGFSKFNRFLRQAHDAEVVDVRRQEDGGYEVLLPAGGKRLPDPVLGAAGAPQPRAAETGAAPAEVAAPVEDRGGRGGRGRGRRGAPSGPPPMLPGQVVGGVDAPAQERPAARVEEPASAPTPAPEDMTPAQAIQEADDGALVTHREPAVVTAQLVDPASIANRGSSTSTGSVGIRGGRGRRGGTPSGPPPLLPGQVINVGGTRSPEPPQPDATRDDPQPEPRAEAPREETPAEPAREERGGRSRGGRGRGRGRDEAPAAEAQPEAQPAAEATAAPAAFDPAALGLPSERDEIVGRIASYNFVGRATGEALADAYGAEVWRTMDENPDAVRELLGARKARPLLEQWGAEREQLIANAPAPAAEAPAEEPVPEPQPAEATEGDTDTTSQDAAGGGRSRSRRGGRGRGRGRGAEEETAPAQAEAVIGDTDPTLVSDAGTGDAPAGTDDVQTPAAQAEEVVGDTDPTLMGDLEADAPRGRSRSRRGGRGRGRNRGEGGEAAAEAPAVAPAPEPAPAPQAA